MANIQVLKRWTTLFWKNVLSKFRKTIKIKLIFRKLNKNLEKFLENFRLFLLNYFSFYTFLKTQLPHWQTQAYDCGRGKTRLGGGNAQDWGGGQLPPLAPCWLRPCFDNPLAACVKIFSLIFMYICSIHNTFTSYNNT